MWPFDEKKRNDRRGIYLEIRQTFLWNRSRTSSMGTVDGVVKIAMKLLFCRWIVPQWHSPCSLKNKCFLQKFEVIRYFRLGTDDVIEAPHNFRPRKKHFAPEINFSEHLFIPKHLYHWTATKPSSCAVQRHCSATKLFYVSVEITVNVQRFNASRWGYARWTAFKCISKLDAKECQHLKKNKHLKLNTQTKRKKNHWHII